MDRFQLGEANEVSRVMELCKNLQHNDPDTTHVHVFWNRDLGFHQIIGVALRSNIMVNTLSLNVSTLLSLNQGADENLANLYRDCIQTVESLRTIRFESFDEDHPRLANLMELLCTAVARNGFIETCYLSNVSTRGLDRLLRMTRSLTSLSVLVDETHVTAFVVDMNSEAWAVNQSLIDVTVGIPVNAAVESVLNGLRYHPCLKHLHVTTHVDNYWDSSVNQFLPLFGEGVQGSLRNLLQSTKTLQSLDIYGISLDKATVHAIFDTLLQNETVTKLTLDHCFLTAEATEYLIPHLQTKYHQDNLVLVSCEYEGTSSGAVCVRFLTNSTLKSLEWSSLDTCRWIVALRNNAAIHLPDLCLRSFDREFDQGIVLFVLPELLRLQSLRLSSHASRGAYAPALVSAMRANGSLHLLSLPDHFFNDEQERLVQAYTQRNKCAPHLVCAAESALLVPYLLAAFQPARRLAPNTFFMGLLSQQRHEQQRHDASSARDVKRQPCYVIRSAPPTMELPPVSKEP